MLREGRQSIKRNGNYPEMKGEYQVMLLNKLIDPAIEAAPEARQPDRRQLPRVPVGAYACLYTRDGFQISVLENLSSGGAFLGGQSDSPKIGEKVRFSLMLNGGAELIKGKGEVRWTSRYTTMAESTYEGFGVLFTNLKEEDQKLINGYIDDWMNRIQSPNPTSRSHRSKVF